MQGKSGKNRALGSIGEDLASKHLENLGFVIIDRNVRYKVGELDIVAMKDGDLHFIEVKTRTDSSFAAPLESITHEKRKRIKRAAEMYICTRKDFKQANLPPCYYSVISIDYSFGKPQVELIIDAFE